MSGTVIQCLPEAAADAARLAEKLGVPCHVIDVHRFPDGELRVTVGPAAPGIILYAPLDHPNDKLIALLLAVEALRRGGTKRLVLVAPYLCYMRQDKAFHDGEAISQKAIGQLIAATVDRVVTVDAHLHRTHDIRAVFPGIEAEDLSAMPAIAAALRGVDWSTVVVGPDEESEPWVGALADKLGLAFAVGRKTRAGDRSVEIAFADPKLFKGRPVLLVDDIVSSGGTLTVAAKALRAAHAATIDAVIVHALFPPETIKDFHHAGIRSVHSTSSVPHPTNAIPLDDILAAALTKEVSL
ncbi:ribose-phosphate diphosphokinase [Microbacteriaceae bacterium K1510]|nr:ribose-phosphate diphosphokinase [Microbacteriaceae bacterium K1510]